LILFTALAAIGPNLLAVTILGILSLAAMILTYRLCLRPLVINDTEIRLPSGATGLRVLALADVAEVGLLLRHNGKQHNSPGWCLEVTDTSGHQMECASFFYAESQRAINKRRQALEEGGDQVSGKELKSTRPGRAALEIYNRVLKQQGPHGPLCCRDCIASRSWVRSGPGEQLGWWSPDGRLIFL
jgi:hypothetical protein